MDELGSLKCWFDISIIINNTGVSTYFTYHNVMKYINIIFKFKLSILNS